MRILMIGDIYGSVGRKQIELRLEALIKEEAIDFIVANGENISHGKSILKHHFQFLKQHNIDVVTSGNHIFDQRSVLEYIDQEPTLLRPYNMRSYLPGNGYCIVKKNNKKVCILNLMGCTFMTTGVNSAYEAMDHFLSLNLKYDLLLIDFHAEATAEKIAFAWNYDGIISGFVGTHTHVQTADEHILPKGTAFITDLGMTGPINSIIGGNPEEIILKEKTGLLTRFEPAKGSGQFCGVIIEFDDNTNKTVQIERIFLKE